MVILIRLAIVISIILLQGISITFGNIKIDESGKLKKEFSFRDTNRIGIKNGKIVSLYGAGDKLSFEIDSELGQIYFRPKVKIEGAITIFVSTDNGEVQEIEASFRDKAGENTDA